MAQQAVTHIKAIDIQNLWGKYHIFGELDPKVNILIGINGSGKTTILNLIVQALNYENFNSMLYTRADHAKITFSPQGTIGLKLRHPSFVS